MKLIQRLLAIGVVAVALSNVLLYLSGVFERPTFIQIFFYGEGPLLLALMLATLHSVNGFRSNQEPAWRLAWAR